ncbi:hypothetical protein ACFPFP_20565 [Bradyrhizobium sp. GCM10023182]|uniref:Uncharacterized protein n=1 Tax=Bradyrhizobium zhengyangense TaxID=2911009 RepID=A0ABS9LQZ8_9BRAD|nr:hypothetical protein [Bradyrhizobium zhengyangense]MCG2669348.1 hypothetical protein [Bradyrhizobium zhengyangense]
MDITVRGWRRRHGTNTFLNFDVEKAELKEASTGGRYPWDHQVVVDRSTWGRINGLSLHTFTDQQVSSGDHGVVISFSKDEIAHMFRLTHGDEIADLVGKLTALPDAAAFIRGPTPPKEGSAETGGDSTPTPPAPRPPPGFLRRI